MSGAGDERVQRVEEAQVFTERTVEELSETVRDAFARIEALTRRLSALEDRLGAMEEREAGEDDAGEPGEASD